MDDRREGLETAGPPLISLTLSLKQRLQCVCVCVREGLFCYNVSELIAMVIVKSSI